MPSFRYLLAAAVAAAVGAGARAAEPVVVELNPAASVGTTIVTVGDVARVSGGDAVTRERVSKIDLAELKARDRGVDLGRLSVIYRLELAGLGGTAVRVAGADRVTVTPARRRVTADEVVAAARDELLRYLPSAPGATAELGQPVVVQLPEVPALERVSVTARPRGRAAVGRVQMDVTVACGGETLLALAVHFEVKDGARLDPRVQPAGGVPADPNAVLVKARQRVEVSINSGGLRAIMAGEAQTDGRLGQTVMVQNSESKKLVPAKVTGPGKLEIELGGTTP